MFWQVAAVVGAVAAMGALVLSYWVARRVGIREPETLNRLQRKLLFVKEPTFDAGAAFARPRPKAERYAFIVNPTKSGVARLREEAYRASSMRYLPEPMWLFTTEEDAGGQIAREAVAAGADVLVAVGGDGTVRAVADAAVELDVALGIVPLGTGNLFARNIDVPVGDPVAAMRGVLDGVDARVDVGRLRVTRRTGHADDHLFLVIAGVGIDAEMVAGADDRMKSRIGWVAYFLSALRHLRAKRVTARVSIDAGDALESQMRTVMFANCGRLPGGVVLVPDAEVDDGWLDIAVADARAGVAGWAELFGEVVLQGTSLPSRSSTSRWRAGRIDHARGRRADVALEVPQRVQVDGDYLGRATAVAAWVDEGRLRIRSHGALARRATQGAGKRKRKRG